MWSKMAMVVAVLVVAGFAAWAVWRRQEKQKQGGGGQYTPPSSGGGYEE